MGPSQIHGVESLHELHLWQLSDQRLMATVHVSLLDPRSFMSAARAIKQIFHRRGIHATTVQPEILGRSAKARGPAAVASETDLGAFGEAAFTAGGYIEVRLSSLDAHKLRNDCRMLIETISRSHHIRALEKQDHADDETTCLLTCRDEPGDCSNFGCCVTNNGPVNRGGRGGGTDRGARGSVAEP